MRLMTIMYLIVYRAAIFSTHFRSGPIFPSLSESEVPPFDWVAFDGV